MDHKFQPKAVLFSFPQAPKSSKMGKIKRERKKYHTVSEKKDNEEKWAPTSTPAYKPQLNTMQNIFAGISIQLSDINKIDEKHQTKSTEVKKEEMQDDVPSTGAESEIMLKSLKSKSDQKGLTKKEKLALKHKRLMEKLDATHKATAELRKRNKKQKQKRDCDGQNPQKSQEDICPMLTPAAIKSSKPNVNQQVAKNVFAIPTFRDDLPALNSVFEARKDIFSIQTKSSILKKKNQKKGFAKNLNFLKKSLMKKMK